MRALLKACPAISGVTFRIHGESGVEEGSYEFWKTVFEGVATCGRKVEIDMHAKGMDQTMIDIAVATGMPVTISPKYWAEHMGMPYHQADIREVGTPQAGTRRHRPDEAQRRLAQLSPLRLWRPAARGPPVGRAAPHLARHAAPAAVGRPVDRGRLLPRVPLLRQRRRRDHGAAFLQGPPRLRHRRRTAAAYADASLAPRWDWEKYEYGHRVWGRLLYNPDAAPDVWRRYMTSHFGDAGPALASALANASRILPIITTAHAPSAGNNTYWPEIYLNQSLVDAAHPGPYTDTPSPKVFGNVSPLDPQLFSRIDDFADSLLKGERTGKYSPIEVAQWIEDYAGEASRHLAGAAIQASGKDQAEYRRLAIDIELQSAIGRFFGAKLRAGVLYRIHEQTGSRAALEACLERYRAAREIWAGLANRAKGVYVPDITVGELRQLRGHWLERLPDIDKDIALVADRLGQSASTEPAHRSPVRDRRGARQAGA